MPATVIFQIPLAADHVRLLMGTACAVFVLAIFGSWLPRVIAWLAQLRAQGAQTLMAACLALIPAAIGLAPLLILIALIRNPMTWISDSAVTKESLLFGDPLTLTWPQIARVTCGVGRRGGPRWITLIASDGRKIGIGNTGVGDFAALQVFLEDKLGPAVMHGCPRMTRR